MPYLRASEVVISSVCTFTFTITFCSTQYSWSQHMQCDICAYTDQHFIHLATHRRLFWLQNAPKTIFGRGYAPYSTGGAYDAHPDPLVGWGGDTPSLYPSHWKPSAPRSQCLRHLGLGASVVVLNSFRCRCLLLSANIKC